MLLLLKFVLSAKLKKVLTILIVRYRECTACFFKRVSKRYYNNKDEIWPKRRDIYARLKELYNRLKSFEEKLSV